MKSKLCAIFSLYFAGDFGSKEFVLYSKSLELLDVFHVMAAIVLISIILAGMRQPRRLACAGG